MQQGCTLRGLKKEAARAALHCARAGGSGYNASKFALRGYTDAARHDLVRAALLRPAAKLNIQQRAQPTANPRPTHGPVHVRRSALTSA